METIHPLKYSFDAFDIMISSQFYHKPPCSYEPPCLYRNVIPYVEDARTGNLIMNPKFSRFPKGSPKDYVDLAYRCISFDPKARPTFAEIINQLEV